MPTKTTKKPAARKISASKAGKAPAVRKPSAPAKAKPAKRPPEPKPESAPAALAVKKTEARPSPPPVPKTAAARSHHDSVSLIDTKPAKKSAADGEVKKKTTILPPISRILEPPKMEKSAAPTPVPPEVETNATEEAIVPAAAAEEEAEPQNVIHIKPPIIVKQLATALGLKPHQLIAELMNFNIFANINQTIEPDVAAKIAENHGFVLEKERREKGGGVHKVEQPVVAPPPPVMAKKEELRPRGPI